MNNRHGLLLAGLLTLPLSVGMTEEDCASARSPACGWKTSSGTRNG